MRWPPDWGEVGLPIQTREWPIQESLQNLSHSLGRSLEQNEQTLPAVPFSSGGSSRVGAFKTSAERTRLRVQMFVIPWVNSKPTTTHELVQEDQILPSSSLCLLGGSSKTN